MMRAVVEWLPAEPAVGVVRRADSWADVRAHLAHAAGVRRSPVTGQREDALALHPVPAIAPERKVLFAPNRGEW